MSLLNLKSNIVKNITCNSKNELGRRIKSFLSRHYTIKSLDMENLSANLEKTVTLNGIIRTEKKNITEVKSNKKDGLYEDYVIINKIKIYL